MRIPVRIEIVSFLGINALINIHTSILTLIYKLCSMIILPSGYGEITMIKVLYNDECIDLCKTSAQLGIQELDKIYIYLRDEEETNSSNLQL